VSLKFPRRHWKFSVRLFLVVCKKMSLPIVSPPSSPTGAELEADWNSKFEAYKLAYPELAKQFQDVVLDNKLPEGWEKALPPRHFFLIQIKLAIFVQVKPPPQIKYPFPSNVTPLSKGENNNNQSGM